MDGRAMTPARLKVIREAVARYDGTSPVWKGAEECWVDLVRECSAEIARLRSVEGQQREALRAVIEAWNWAEIACVEDEGVEALEDVRRALRAGGSSSADNRTGG